MPYGYNGKILEVNLAEHTYEIIEKNESWYRRYLGGRGIGAYYLLNEMKAGTDPLGPDNILVFAASVVTGVSFPGNARASVVAKSPLTGGFGEAEAGGHWGPQLKFAGFDAVVFRGVSAEPVYLYIHNGEVQFRPAGALWGMSTVETDAALVRELGVKKIHAATIGQAGENMVRYACITAGPHDVFGRMGMGAVMGSKNLKAVVVHGDRRPEVKDPERIKEINKWFGANFKDPDKNGIFHDVGTAIGVSLYNEVGSLPYRNFQGGTIAGGEALSGLEMQDRGLMVGKASCFACPVACRKTAKVEGAGELDTDGLVHSPEYETIGALGSNCGITDPRVVIKAGRLCDEYGLDTISAGVTASFLMECAEKGIIDKHVLGGVPLEFGSAEALFKILELTAKREGFGDQAAEGVMRLAAELGNGAQNLAVHGKGEELALQDPRGGKIGAAIGYAVAHNGGDHIHMEHDFQFNQAGPFLESMEPLGITAPVPTMDLGLEKVKFFVVNHKLWGLYNMLDICIFVPAPGHTMPLNFLRDIINASTGWETSWYELMQAAERGIVMTRVFNRREGFTKADDKLPRRLNEPLTNGRAEGSCVDAAQLQQAVRYYYELMGWDSDSGMPTPAKLRQLDLEWLL